MFLLYCLSVSSGSARGLAQSSPRGPGITVPGQVSHEGHEGGTRGHVPDEACSHFASVHSAGMLPCHWPSVGRWCCPITCLEGDRAGTFLPGSSPPAASPDGSPCHSEKSQSPSNAPRSCPMLPFPLALSFPAMISCGPAGLLAGPPTHQTRSCLTAFALAVSLICLHSWLSRGLELFRCIAVSAACPVLPTQCVPSTQPEPPPDPLFFSSMYCLFFLRLYLFVGHTEREREHKRGERQAEGEGETDSLLIREPDAGLDPRTPRSCPEPKAAASLTEPRGRPCVLPFDLLCNSLTYGICLGVSAVEQELGVFRMDFSGRCLPEECLAWGNPSRPACWMDRRTKH
ncbi:protein LTO1 homolog isoform X2 [Mustela putorius furo]|uniref:Protein LTO1 homolog isoform X2 n=1 Tax=Mustela putorius furo TaxID=9669 RepID=A0A8U0UPY6_MUSPF|nr:protein LTO1 homolog isoform X2 [Mustela putorius furo]